MMGDCGNASTPVAEGLSMTYRSTLEGLGETDYTTTFSDVKLKTSFTMTTDVGEGEAIAITWTCTGEGMLSARIFTDARWRGGSQHRVRGGRGRQPSPPRRCSSPAKAGRPTTSANATMPDVGAGDGNGADDGHDQQRRRH